MKNKWFIIGLIYILAVLFASVSYGQNILINSGFETGKTGWKNTGGTFSITSTAPNFLIQKQSASFVASAAAQYFESNPYVVPKGLWDGDCMASFLYNGADANGYLTVLDGSNVELIPTANRLILNAAAGTKTAKVYFTCPSSGSFKIRVQSTAAMAIGYFDSAVLGKADFNGASNKTSFTPFTPLINGTTSGTFVVGTGGGAVYTAEWARDGQEIIVNYKVRSGTSGASDIVGAYAFSLPSGIQFDSSVTLYSAIGIGETTNIGSANPTTRLIAKTYNSTQFVLNASDSSLMTNAVNSLLNNANTTSISIRARVLGWGISENSINSKCPNDIACENTFSAKVSSTGVVSDENLDWLSTCGGFAPYVCNFNSGIFTTAPSCTVTLGSTGGTESRINAISASSITVAAFNSTGATANGDFVLVCRKAGADFKAKQNIQGFLSSTVTSAANNIRTEFASVDILCSSSPCTISRQSGVFTSITRGGVGVYAANIQAGTFSDKPTCTVQVNTVGANHYSPIDGSSTSPINVSFRVATITTTPVLADSMFNIICYGPR